MIVCLFLGRALEHAQRKLVFLTAFTRDLRCDFNKITLTFPIIFRLWSLFCPVQVEQTTPFHRNLSCACYKLCVLGEYISMTLNYC